VERRIGGRPAGESWKTHQPRNSGVIDASRRSLTLWKTISLVLFVLRDLPGMILKEKTMNAWAMGSLDRMLGLCITMAENAEDERVYVKNG